MLIRRAAARALLLGVCCLASAAGAQCEAVDVPGVAEGCRLSQAELRGFRERWLTKDKRDRVIALLTSGQEVSNDDFRRAGLPALSRGPCAPSPVALDLRGIDLRGGATRLALRNLRVNGADLRGATFQNVDLTEATFYGANLSGAAFFDADLSGATFRCAVLDDVLMRGVNAVGTVLSATRGHRIEIASAGSPSSPQSLQNVSFSEADWEGARFSDLNIRGAMFLGASLAGARIESTTFRDSTFDRATLQNAVFRGSAIVNSDIREADVSGLNAVSSCLVRVSFAGVLGREPANLHTSSVAGLDLGQVHPLVLGLRSVQWGEGVPIQLCEVPGASAPGQRITVAEPDERRRRQELIRTYAALREYYRSEAGFNPTQARKFEYELAELKRVEYWSTKEFAAYGLLTLSYWFHGHGSRPSRLLYWLIGPIAATWLLAGICEYFRRRNRPKAGTGVSACRAVWCLPVIWFFGLVENAIDLRGVFERLGWEASPDVERDLRVLFLAEAAVGAVWLFMSSTLALERLLLP